MFLPPFICSSLSMSSTVHYRQAHPQMYIRWKCGGFPGERNNMFHFVMAHNILNFSGFCTASKLARVTIASTCLSFFVRWGGKS